MMFRHTHVLLAVLAAATAIPSVVHAGDGTTCLVTTICDGNEPQLADCTDEKGATFQACCPPTILTGGDPAAGEGFTCLKFGDAPPTVVAEVPAAAAVTDPAAAAVVDPAPVVPDTTPAVVPDPVAPAVSEPEATPNSGDCNLSNDATLNNCQQYGAGSVPYTCNRDAAFPSGNSYACCPDDQGLPDNVILDDPSTGQLNACLVTPSDDINNPTDDPTPGPTPDPTPGPTPEPTNDPTPGPTPDPTPGPTDDPTPGPTPNPTPGPTDVPTPNPTPGPTEPPQDNSDENLVDAPREASGTGTSPTAMAATATLAAAAAAALL
mmetsp:Transcript_47492/g.53762  ORF Transcript_47492/g.53762 Transcript_47492/m.53762 type:complete len:321 (+) Transcript_47492:85-1047(+)